MGCHSSRTERPNFNSPRSSRWQPHFHMRWFFALILQQMLYTFHYLHWATVLLGTFVGTCSWLFSWFSLLDRKSRDWHFVLYHRFEIWQAHRQHCCRSACQISDRSDTSKYKSCGFETSRDLTIRHHIWYWNGPIIRITAYLSSIRPSIRHTSTKH